MLNGEFLVDAAFKADLHDRPESGKAFGVAQGGDGFGVRDGPRLAKLDATVAFVNGLIRVMQ